MLRTGGNAGVGVAHSTRLGARQHQRLHGAVGVRCLHIASGLVVDLLAGEQQQRPLACLGTGALQGHGVALQVVGAVASHQGLVVGAALGHAGMDVVRPLVVCARGHAAQVLYVRASAHADMGVQVVDAGAGLRGVYFMHEATCAGGHVHDQGGRLDAGGGLVGQCQDDGAAVGAGGNVQVQPLAAQRTVGPGKGRSLVGFGNAFAGGGQGLQQSAAFGAVQGVEPAHVDGASGGVVKRDAPFGRSRRRGIFCSRQPVVQRGRWQVVKGFAAPGNPAVGVQLLARVVAGGVAGHGVRLLQSRCGQCAVPAPACRLRQCGLGPGAAQRRAAAIRSFAGSAR